MCELGVESFGYGILGLKYVCELGVETLAMALLD